MASGIVLGMNYLHTAERPVIHADLKMKNILVSEGYKPKVRRSVILRLHDEAGSTSWIDV